MKSQLLLLLGIFFSASFLFSCNDDDQDEGPLEGSGNITFYINEPISCQEIIFMLFSPDGRETPGRL